MGPATWSVVQDANDLSRATEGLPESEHKAAQSTRCGAGGGGNGVRLVYWRGREHLSKQAPLISLRVSTGHESFTEGGQFLRRILSADFLYFGPCKLITAFVIRVPSMPFKPLPIDAVPGSDLIKLPPQVVVLDGFTVYGAPIVGFPT